jgi:hypothetical protein
MEPIARPMSLEGVTRRCDVTERQIRDLLDDAVADVTPRAGDPTADVLRRHRRYRRRRGVAVAAIMVLVVAGGIAAVPRLDTRRPGTDALAPAASSEPTIPVQLGPATPRVVGNEVVAGGLVIPIPPGWRTIDDGRTTYCNLPPRTIAVGFEPVPGGTGRYCSQKPYISVIGSRPTPGLLGHQSPVRKLRQMTMPGGQPAWLTYLPNTQGLGGIAYNDTSVYLPWSGAIVTLGLDMESLGEILSTMRTRPVQLSTLKLPGSVVSAQMIGPISHDLRGKSSPLVTDPAVIAQALDRLNSLTEVVDNDQDACADLAAPTAAVMLNTSTGLAAVVVITLAGYCRQATASLGGRVSVPRGFGNDLWRLLGGRGAVEPVK